MARTRTIELEAEQKKISWGDSYMSLLLGMVVVVVVGFIIFSFAKNKANFKTRCILNTKHERKRND